MNSSAVRSVIVIPSRYGSTRYPGKPLAVVSGKSLLRRTWEIASQVTNVDRVVVATDDDRIASHVSSFGAEAVMTAPECKNGTERVYDALKRLGWRPEIIINLQGDALLTPPWVVQALVDEMSKHREVLMATPAVPMEGERLDQFIAAKKVTPTTGTLVTFSKDKNALYFSRALIPAMRGKGAGALYQHLGVYAYRYEALERYLEFPPGQFEQVEQLEQLRALESGMPIRVVLVDLRGRSTWSVDSPEDVKTAEEIIAREGELIG